MERRAGAKNSFPGNRARRWPDPEKNQRINPPTSKRSMSGVSLRDPSDKRYSWCPTHKLLLMPRPGGRSHTSGRAETQGPPPLTLGPAITGGRGADRTSPPRLVVRSKGEPLPIARPGFRSTNPEGKVSESHYVPRGGALLRYAERGGTRQRKNREDKEHGNSTPNAPRSPVGTTSGLLHASNWGVGIPRERIRSPTPGRTCGGPPP